MRCISRKNQQTKVAVVCLEIYKIYKQNNLLELFIYIYIYIIYIYIYISYIFKMYNLKKMGAIKFSYNDWEENREYLQKRRRLLLLYLEITPFFHEWRR